MNEPWDMSRPTVYFVEMRVDGRGAGPIKIGIADDVAARLGTLQTASPYEVRLLLELGGGKRREEELHDRFRKDHLRGEWFRASAEIAAFITDSAEEAAHYKAAHRTPEEITAALLGVSVRSARKKKKS